MMQFILFGGISILPILFLLSIIIGVPIFSPIFSVLINISDRLFGLTPSQAREELTRNCSRRYDSYSQMQNRFNRLFRQSKLPEDKRSELWCLFYERNRIN